MSLRPQSRRAALVGTLAFLLTAPGFLMAAPAWAQRPAIAPLSADDKVLVDKAVTYLQGLAQAEGRFVQTDERGRISQGKFYLKRPGKARFAWDPPTDQLMVSDGHKVSVQNTRLGTTDVWPLVSNPLSIFLAKEIRLDRGIVVSQVRRFADGFSITARDGKKEAEGQIVMVFGGTPVALREWTTINAQGGKVRVVLSSLSRPASLDPSLFIVRDPRTRPGTARPK